MAKEKGWRELFEASLPSQCPSMCEKLKEWHLNVEKRAELIYDNLSKFIFLPGKSFLDFGCGEGGMAIYFAEKGMQVSAADVTEAQLKRTALRALEAQARVQTLLINPDGKIPQVKDEQFDVILCHTVIEHCPEPENTIREM